MSAFADLPEDDLEAAINGPKDLSKVPNIAPTGFVENCPKCRGGGRFISYTGRDLGSCFNCGGTGKMTFKTSREQRQRDKSKSAGRKVRKAQANLDAFKISHPDVFAWFDGSTFEFAIQMRASVEKFGSLTERQLAASYRSAARRAEVMAESKARVDSAPAIDTSKIEAAFAQASSILKKPKLRVAGMVISHAPATSKNAGALYVKSATQTNAEGARLYLGKIMGGKFIRSRECADDQEAAILGVAQDPKGAAIVYGRVTGQCACCGRPLENKESVERGIGPVCAEKFGWGG